MKDWKFCTVIVDQNDIVYSVQPRDTFTINSQDTFDKQFVFQKLHEDGWELSDSHTELTQKEGIVGNNYLTFIFRRKISIQRLSHPMGDIVKNAVP